MLDAMHLDQMNFSLLEADLQLSEIEPYWEFFRAPFGFFVIFVIVPRAVTLCPEHLHVSAWVTSCDPRRRSVRNVLLAHHSIL